MDEIKSRIRIYISSTINNDTKVHNEEIAQLLEHAGLFDVCLPQNEIPSVHHAELERWAPRYCVRYIDRADLVLLVIDSYGKDCSWEIGYAFGLRKPIVGYASDVINFERHKEDWMVKNAISCIMTTSWSILQSCRRDKMLKDIPVDYVKKVEELPKHILEFYHHTISEAGEETLMLEL